MRDTWQPLTGDWPAFGDIDAQKAHFHPQVVLDRQWMLLTGGDPASGTNQVFLLDIADLDADDRHPDVIGLDGASLHQPMTRRARSTTRPQAIQAQDRGQRGASLRCPDGRTGAAPGQRAANAASAATNGSPLGHRRLQPAPAGMPRPRASQVDPELAGVRLSVDLARSSTIASR